MPLQTNELNTLWNYRRPIQDESAFRTLVYRLIEQIPGRYTGILQREFNTLFQQWVTQRTRASSDNLFNWIDDTFQNIPLYDDFYNYIMAPAYERRTALENIPRADEETEIENNSAESESDDSIRSADQGDIGDIQSGGEEDEGGRRNPYALLEQKGHEGKFTAQFKARKPHLRHLKTLGEFAHYILANPTEFNKISKQRANYYKNLIERKGGMMNMNYQTYISEFDDLLAKINRHRDMLPSMASDLPPATQELFNPDIQTALNYINSHYPTIVQRLRQINVTQHRNRFPMFHDGAEYRHSTNQTTSQEYTESINRLREFSNTIEDMVTQIAKDISNYEISQEARRGLGRLSKKMMKDLRAYHRQVGGKISTKDFNLMLKESYKKPQDRDKHIGDYYIDESLSTPENVVYHNPKTGETKVAYRGTEGTLKDWGNNALYAFGLHNTSKRYKRSNEIQKQVEQKYGTANLDVLGHSQSGAFSQEIGKNAKNVIVLNPATHPGYSPKTKNTTVVRSTGDAVSGLKYLNPLNWGKKKTADVEIKAKTYNPIEEHMPSVLERLPEEQMLGEGRKRKKINKKLMRLCNCCGAKCPYCR